MAADARIRSLDLIRGVAVLGIVAVNAASFAAPSSAAYAPGPPGMPTSAANHAAYLITLVLFEGKMRALFSVLFGAGMLLFIGRADAAGRHGEWLQLRRLFWLLLIGYAHFALLWDGDILLLYAAIGFAAFTARGWQPRQQIGAALLILALWQVWGTAQWMPSVLQEYSAAPADQRAHAAAIAEFRAEDARGRAEAKLAWPDEVAARIDDRADQPLNLVAYNWGETLAWMLLGMALLRGGFFAGGSATGGASASGWPRQRLWRLAGWGLGLGGAATLAFAAWAEAAGYPPVTMHYALSFGMAVPHVLMALGYAALLVLAAPRILRSVLGQQLEAAGRMAFSNYLGTSLIMGALCSGWGLGLFGQFGAAQRWTLVLLVWALMLSWSQPWLTRYRQGPLEWLWRCLTEWRVLGFMR